MIAKVQKGHVTFEKNLRRTSVPISVQGRQLITESRDVILNNTFSIFTSTKDYHEEIYCYITFLCDEVTES